MNLSRVACAKFMCNLFKKLKMALQFTLLIVFQWRLAEQNIYFFKRSVFLLVEPESKIQEPNFKIDQ